MTNSGEITVNWVGGNSLPSATVEPEQLAVAGAELAERLIAAGFDAGIAYDMWEMWIKAAEKIAVEAIHHAVPSEKLTDYVRVAENNE